MFVLVAAVGAIFSVFALGLGYAQVQTRGLVGPGARLPE